MLVGMKHRRVFAVGALLGAAGWAACSSDYGENPTTPGTDASTDETAADASDVVVDTAIFIDGQSPDALIVRDAGTKGIDAASCDATCDCDKDGFDRPNCGDGGEDCDDTDQRVRPDQGFLEIPGEPPRNGDWNCKNGVEKLYPVNINCSGMALGACSSVQGFSNDPDCGTPGTYVFCAVSGGGIFCAVGATQSRLQACK